MEKIDMKAKSVMAGLFAAAVALGIAAGQTSPFPKPSGASEQPAVSNETARVAETGTGITVTKAADWSEKYPNQFATYMQNDENDEIHSYLELHPYLKTLYRGYGFAIQYGSARGHTYVVEDVQATGRPHAMANCYTCKTSNMTAKVLNEGDSAYAMKFDDLSAEITDAFGCFHCHQNEPGVLYVTHRYLSDAVAGVDQP